MYWFDVLLFMNSFTQLLVLLSLAENITKLVALQFFKKGMFLHPIFRDHKLKRHTPL